MTFSNFCRFMKLWMIQEISGMQTRVAFHSVQEVGKSLLRRMLETCMLWLGAVRNKLQLFVLDLLLATLSLPCIFSRSSALAIILWMELYQVLILENLHQGGLIQSFFMVGWQITAPATSSLALLCCWLMDIGHISTWKFPKTVRRIGSFCTAFLHIPLT